MQLLQLKLVVFPALLVALAAAGIPSPCRAGLCQPTNSTVPWGIAVVGTSAGVADRFGMFTVTVRDFSNNLIPNAVVIVDFSPALSQVRVGQSQPFPGSIVDCTTHTVGALTNASGVATFDIVGAAFPNGAPSSPTVTISADGCVLGHVPVVAYDLDAVGGMGANDLAIWTSCFLSGHAYLVGDYDYNGRLGANDLAVWIDVFLQAGSTVSASPVCP